MIPQFAWIIDSGIEDRSPEHTGYPKLSEAVAEAGMPVFRFSLAQGAQVPDLDMPLGTVAYVYGSIPFVNRVLNVHNALWVPVANNERSSLSYGQMATYLGGRLLNEDFVILPFSEVVRRRPASFGGAIFLKPFSNAKVFTGLSITEEEFDHEINCLRQIQRPDEHLLCVVAPIKDIVGEYRFVIVDRKIVAGSQYRWDGKLDIRIDIPAACWAMAEEVAELPWQPDDAYVVDIAQVPDGTARVVEMNALSTSGLYACDTRAIVEAVTNHLRKIFR